MAIPIRRLDGIVYWVIEDENGIYDFINTQLRQEWVADAKDEGRKLEEDSWLRELSKRKWRLEILELSAIKPNPYEFVRRGGYDFEKRLEERSRELRRAIEKYGSTIWPITIRGEDMQLVDGYCRFTALRDMGIARTYAYVGKLQPSSE